MSAFVFTFIHSYGTILLKATNIEHKPAKTDCDNGSLDSANTVYHCWHIMSMIVAHKKR